MLPSIRESDELSIGALHFFDKLKQKSKESIADKEGFCPRDLGNVTSIFRKPTSNKGDIYDNLKNNKNIFDDK